MAQSNHSPQPTLEKIRGQFAAWRRARKRRAPIPARLWKAAVSLAGQYPTHRIAATLRLNYTELQKRISLAAAARQPAASAPSPCLNFIEYPLAPPGGPQCLIEMENRHGDKMRVMVWGEHDLELAGLGRSFWVR